ncbi:MAG TPA: hypothetical protein VFQ79_20205 [Bryobacteraceae bacterium]|nr:hypothetical protein [Bryobacteraceae bacterium]
MIVSDMLQGSPVVTFTIEQSHENALQAVKRALAKQNLRVPAQLDITAGLKQDLRVNLGPCVVLFVDDPVLLLEAIIFQRGSAVFMPLAISVSGDHRRTTAMLRSAESLIEGGAPPGLVDPLLSLHSRVLKAMDTIGQRERDTVLLTA